ncbi:MAG TPA: hypothetical protein VGM28_00875 [Candidatus Limnocylindrales bacterium]|jgi:hypothetical protein
MSDQLEQDLEALLARRAASSQAELAAQRTALAALPDRHRHVPVLARAAVILVALGIVAAAAWRLEGFVASPPTQPAPPSVAPATAPATPIPSPSSADRTPPTWINSLVGMLQCKWPIAPIGAAVSSPIQYSETAATPDAALAAFLAGDGRHYATIPLSGWERLDDSPRWTLYGSLNEGRRVALVVMQDEGPRWRVYQLAACDAADFAPGLPLSTGDAEWIDESGTSVPAKTLSMQPDCYDGTLLRLDGRLYARDLAGGAYAREELASPFDLDAALPADAIDTGFRQGTRLLFRAADDSAVYVLSPLRFERWPRVKGDEVVRTDCN